MSAPGKVSEQQIRAALEVWAGNVAATAQALGIAENPLRRRLARLGIGAKALLFLRSRPTHTHPFTPMVPTPQGVSVMPRPNHPENAVHTFTAPAKAHTLLSMNAEVVEAPMRRMKAGPIRLRPDQVEQLRDAKFDFMAKYRAEAAEADLLQRFFDELFGEWLKRTLTDKKAKA